MNSTAYSGEAEQHSGASRTAFRGEAEQDSGLKPNTFCPTPECGSACPGIRNRPRRFRCVVASTWRRMDRAVPVVPLHGGVRAAAGVRPWRLDPVSACFGGVQEPGLSGMAGRALEPRRVTGSGARDGRQPAESPAVPRQGRRVPARVGDYMRTIDPIDLALTITNGH